MFPRVGPENLITVPPETVAAFLALLDKEKRGPATASITPAAPQRKAP